MIKKITPVAAALLLLIVTLLPGFVSAAEQTGKDIAFDRSKGNCLACHAIEDGDMPGNIGPPLIVMKARFPDREALKAQIWDATVKNPISIMPPFGEHDILSDTEIEKILDYLYTL